MSVGIYLALVAMGLTGLLFVVKQARTYAKFRGARVITCPETNAPAGVVVNARHAAATALHKFPELRLQSCSRWPERGDCGQECLRQIEATPEDCLVRNVLTRWYSGKYCCFCKQPLGEIRWAEHKPALMSPSGKTLEWGEVHSEDVFHVLKTHRAVCWRCHIVQTFCREHPELILDRSREWPPSSAPVSR
jgi:hypothetical protein